MPFYAYRCGIKAPSGRFATSITLIAHSNGSF